MPDPLPIRPTNASPGRRPAPWRTILLLLAVSLITYVTPGLSRLRPTSAAAATATWRQLVARTPTVRLVEWRANQRPIELPAGLEGAVPDPGELHEPVAVAGLRLAAAQWTTNGKGSTEVVPLSTPRPRPALPGREIEDPGGVAMTAFYTALSSTMAGHPGAVTRVLHFGDSPVTGDLISSGARARVQGRYGDAGHGFIFLDRPWEWYNHHGVELSASGWRMLSPLFRAGNDGCYGLGGVCFLASAAATCTVGTVPKGVGTRVSRFDVFYQARPEGGTFIAEIDGEPAAEISTASPYREVRVQSLETGDGPHELTLRPKGDGEVVLFGIALERPGPGVVWDSLGTNGGTMHFLTLIDEACWREALRLRNPHLVILNYGTNESGYGYFKFPAYAEDIRRVVGRIREAVPGASILLMAPMDRGTFDESGAVITLPTIPRIIDTQRTVAAATGCAYFDTFRAMGGEGTMGRWYKESSRLVTGDLTHPTGAGADLVSGLLVGALEAGLARHAASTQAAPDTLPVSPDQAQPPPSPEPDPPRATDGANPHGSNDPTLDPGLSAPPAAT